LFVQAALCEQARTGDLVYHGHVGHLLLPGIAHLIRVRVIAGTEFRLEAVRRERGLDRRAAQAYLDRVDRDRREWARFLFGVEWDDPYLYDLVLNLDRISLGTACETVARLTEREEFQPTAASRRAMDDLSLVSRVRAVLAGNPTTRDADLTVVADDGRVTITGATPFAAVPECVSFVVQTVEGVKDVRTDIEVLPLTYYSML
ncbi:MAG TPA: cytidylate kinase family protein, partial [Candidatus Sulfotelmatobacter sp.]|nr:cytidylate kinase family protein [Candidatus Sulfotelmatobacter sp.]